MSTFVAAGRKWMLAGGVSLALVLTGAAGGQQLVSPEHAQAAAGTTAGAEASLKALGESAWRETIGGKEQELLGVLRSTPDLNPGTTALRGNVDSLIKNIEKRETTRQAKFDEAKKKMEEELAKNTDKGLSEGLRRTLEMYLLRPEGAARAAFKDEAWVKDIIKRSDETARESEGKGNWFTANELYFRLNALMEEEGTYKTDQRRLGLRLGMIRLYVPQQFWQLRNDERMAAGKPGLPAYNDLGERFQDKIEGINRSIVWNAIVLAARQHIDRNPQLLNEMLASGLESVRTLVTTHDLEKAFPGLKNAAAREAMVAAIDQRMANLAKNPGPLTQTDLVETVDQLIETSKTTVGLDERVVLHEFGNGAMSRLDEFTALIWPDEVARFDRMTQGNFKGVGIQIQIDDESQLIKVVTPIEGTPAQRAGIRMGDLIKKIDGKSAVGISLNQAVDLITGPADTRVSVTMERPDENDANGSKEIDFDLTRAVIKLHTVKGWRRTGAREDDWDWMIDPVNNIGYVRLTQFTEETTDDLRAAITSMKKSHGRLGGLILDLRYNPGGLLTEAVSVANTFIDSGTIVSTRGTLRGEEKSATPGQSLLRDVPVTVLVNEGSASASEIVSGAVRYYTDKGDINAALIGQRTFGKGSVQNVIPLTQDGSAKMKLTTQYYYLPGNKLIHRKPGASQWGVDPHLKIEDLAENLSDALKLRQDADVLPVDEHGKIVESKAPRPNPQELLDKGLDLQLQHALAVLQSQAVSKAGIEQARIPENSPRTTQ